MRLNFQTAGGGLLTPEVLARLDHARRNVSFKQVFQTTGLQWLSDQSHQFSCPFHARYRDGANRPVERNPSARFYAQDRRIWCFACDEGGDVVWFWRKAYKIEFLGDAIRDIYKKFGLGDIDTQVVLRQEKERERSIQHLEPVRADILKKVSDPVNDILWQTGRADPELTVSLDRITEVMFDRRFEIELGRYEFTEFSNRLVEWQLWALDMIERTIAIKHSVSRG